MFTVLITEKGGSQKRLTFTEPEVTIGRVPGNDVVLPKGNVSKRHSRIVLKDSRFIVVDLKSTNGTYVNGRKITSPLVVKEGDKIYIGDFILTLEGDAALTAPAEAMKPPSVLPNNGETGSLPASVPPPLPSRAPDPMADDIPAVLRGGSNPPSSPPSGSANTSVNMQAPSIPPVIAGEDVDRAVPEHTNVVAFQSEEHTASEKLPSQAIAIGSAPVRTVAPIVSSKVSVPVARDDLGSLMKRLGQEFDVDNSDAAALADEKRWQRAEKAIQGKLGELSNEGAITRGADKPGLARAALHEAVGLGPIDALLSDVGVRQVLVERFDRVRIDRGQGLKLESSITFSSPFALLTVARRLLATAGADGDLQSVDLALPNGVQLVAVMPNAASEGPVLSLRRRPAQVTELSSLELAARISGAHAEQLREALSAGKHIWLVTPGDADAAPLVTGLLESVHEEQRVALFERSPEIALGQRAAVCFKLGVVPLSELLERVRYFKPDRLVLHELRDEDLDAAIGTLAQRHDGAIVSVRASSAEELVTAIEKCEKGALSARAISLIAELAREPSGDTKVVQLRQLESSPSGKLSLKGF
jgi:pilus assembly protein CpaF